MTRVISALADVAAGYDTVLCDLWGCLHDGVRAYAPAVAALQAFRAGGGKVALLTNAPRPAAAVHAQLDGMGVPDDCRDVIVSSGDATQHELLAGAVGRRIWHLGPPKDDALFTHLPREAPQAKRVPLAEAEGIVCTGLFDDRTETPEDYRTRLSGAVARGLPMLCANPDIVVDLGDQRLWCAGALAQLYEELGGRTLHAGKPHAPIYDLACERLGGNVGRILAIGDGVSTDIAGAAAQGIDALFVTGGLAQGEFGGDVENPDPSALDSWLRAHGLDPAYSIGRLR